eukprot:TRINITY_DN1447_c0_g1_i7.p1 TRINITY_DN1447_c0_g1~~TRINITY_DN1447_c0_g1_i7.p1  ORF type:complete len:142 (-),score=19.44 TRINITY_DN1447_c0_g1_i7:95-520(-)
MTATAIMSDTAADIKQRWWLPETNWSEDIRFADGHFVNIFPAAYPPVHPAVDGSLFHKGRGKSPSGEARPRSSVCRHADHHAGTGQIQSFSPYTHTHIPSMPTIMQALGRSSHSVPTRLTCRHTHTRTQHVDHHAGAGKIQ